MIRLLIVDDHTVMRQVLIENLNTVKDICVIADFDSGEDALENIEHVKPDVIILDISLAGMDGIETAKAIRKQGNVVPILCLTMHRNRVIMQRAMAAGVNGYVVKHDAFDDLLYAIRKVAKGQHFISPQFNPVAEFSADIPAAPINRTLSQLSTREQEVLLLIAGGKTTKTIARQLNISIRTVDAHRRNIKEKTGLNGVAEMTQFAIHCGMITDH